MPKGQAGTGTSASMAVQVDRTLISQVDSKIKTDIAGTATLSGMEFTDRQIAGVRTKFVENAIREKLSAKPESESAE